VYTFLNHIHHPMPFTSHHRLPMVPPPPRAGPIQPSCYPIL
jgi:hypothetical protein